MSSDAVDIDQLLHELGETLVVSKQPVKANSGSGGGAPPASATRRGSGVSRGPSGLSMDRSRSEDTIQASPSSSSRGHVRGGDGEHWRRPVVASERGRRGMPVGSSSSASATAALSSMNHGDGDSIDSLLFDLDNVLKDGTSDRRTDFEKTPSAVEPNRLHSNARRYDRDSDARGTGVDRHDGECLHQRPQTLLRAESGAKATCSSRCVMPTLGGSRAARRCTVLLCTRCDNRVLMFDDKAWKTSNRDDGAGGVTYLFLRNVYPSRSKMLEMLVDKRGNTAYACQCMVRKSTRRAHLPDSICQLSVRSSSDDFECTRT